MKKSLNVNLKSYDDIFTTEEERIDEGLERVQNINVNELHPFKNHPFKVLDDDDMQKTVDSIKEYGVLTPAIARPRDEGGYELVSGHRRHHASQLAGLETMPVIVRELDDDEATLLMVDSNLQRETLFPSERAFAYKMKLDALKHQGERRDLTSDQIGQKLTARKIVAQEVGIGEVQIQRYIRLTELNKELLDMVDNKQISFNPAVELSYLKQDEQEEFIDAMEYAQNTPSLSQAQRIKKMSNEGMCTFESMCAVLSEEKKSEKDKISIKYDDIRKYFPKSYTPKNIEEKIIQLVENWAKKRQQNIDR